MSTISVPIPQKLESKLALLVESGYGSNKADAIRRAIEKVYEDEIINALLKAQNEPSLRGDLTTLAKKFK